MNKLWVRLSLTFSGVVLVAVLIVLVSSVVLAQAEDRQSFTARFLEQPGGLVEQLANYYQTHQGWTGVESALMVAQSVYRQPDVALFLADQQNQVLYHPQSELVGQPLNQTEAVLVLPIQVDQQTVGYLGLTPIPGIESADPRPSPFIRIVGDALLLIAVVGGIGGIVFGVVMSRSLTAPLNDLAEAAQAIGARKLSQRVAEKGSDELRAVARAFNQMASDLEQGEQLRRNLLADVAHELRTPISVLQANLQAILDEVYPLDQTEIAHLYEQSRLLGRLAEDLHLLAQAEARQLPLHLQETNLVPLVKGTVDTFRPSAEAKGVTLNTQFPTGTPSIQVDTARINQVLQNLLANALRHTPANGTITMCIQAEPEAISLSVADTGDGISPEHLPHIFDRFYRPDPARSRDRGGAGLGLAIARAIVEAHGGRIKATSQGIPGQGSKFTIYLPLSMAYMMNTQMTM
jgi:signal transduction histidine kinase